MFANSQSKTTRSVILLRFLSILSFMFWLGGAHGNCYTREELESTNNINEIKELVSKVENEILSNQNLFLMETNSNGSLYLHPENENMVIRVYTQVEPQSFTMRNIAASLRASEAQMGDTISRWAVQIYQSACVSNKDSHLRNDVYLVEERFMGDMQDIFNDDHDFYNAFHSTETRLDLYRSLFVKYQRVMASNMKHCDFRPRNIYYKLKGPGQYLVVFANFSSLRGRNSFCEVGSLSFMSPDTANEPSMKTDGQKQKSELFSLALTVLKLELDYFNVYYSRAIAFAKEEENNRLSKSDDSSTLIKKFPRDKGDFNIPLWAALVPPASLKSYFLSPASNEDKYNLVNIFKITMANLEILNRNILNLYSKKNDSWNVPEFRQEILYYAELLDFTYTQEVGVSEAKPIQIKQKYSHDCFPKAAQYHNFWVVILRNLRLNDLVFGRPDLPTTLLKSQKTLHRFQTIQCNVQFPNQDLLKRKTLDLGKNRIRI